MLCRTYYVIRTDASLLHVLAVPEKVALQVVLVLRFHVFPMATWRARPKEAAPTR